MEGVEHSSDSDSPSAEKNQKLEGETLPAIEIH